MRAESGAPGAKVRPPPVGLTMMPQLCSYFTDSHCAKGYFCTFAHSVDELRVRTAPALMHKRRFLF
jgi:hypothetical protein